MDSIVSVIIPVYNRENLVRETLDSLLAQTFVMWECIVVDDGSTDNTWKTLQEYSAKDARFKIFKRNREPKGAPTCRNIGTSLAIGDYLMFMDSDDIMGTECLAFRCHQIKKHPKSDSVIFDTSIFKIKIGDDDRMWNKLITERDDLVRFLQIDMPWSVCGPLWKNNELLKFSENISSGQDWEFHIRFLLSGKAYNKVTSSDKLNHVFCRRNDRNISITSSEKNLTEGSRFMNTIFLTVIRNSSKTIHQEAAIKLLLRNSINLKRNKLGKEALKTWRLAKKSKPFNYISYLGWYIYILLYNSLTSRSLEFIIFRILNKTDMLNYKSTHLNQIRD